MQKYTFYNYVVEALHEVYANIWGSLANLWDQTSNMCLHKDSRRLFRENNIKQRQE